MRFSWSRNLAWAAKVGLGSLGLGAALLGCGGSEQGPGPGAGGGDGGGILFEEGGGGPGEGGAGGDDGAGAGRGDCTPPSDVHPDGSTKCGYELNDCTGLPVAVGSPCSGSEICVDRHCVATEICAGGSCQPIFQCGSVVDDCGVETFFGDADADGKPDGGCIDPTLFCVDHQCVPPPFPPKCSNTGVLYCGQAEIQGEIYACRETCPDGTVCPASGVCATEAQCQPTTCEERGFACGTLNSCGVAEDCGTCGDGAKCVQHECVPTLCATVGAHCGTVASACTAGVVETCAGQCASDGETCVEDPADPFDAGICGTCVPLTCEDLSLECHVPESANGTPDGCGGILFCYAEGADLENPCPGDATCQNGLCCPSCDGKCGVLRAGCAPCGDPFAPGGGCESGETCDPTADGDGNAASGVCETCDEPICPENSCGAIVDACGIRKDCGPTGDGSCASGTYCVPGTTNPDGTQSAGVCAQCPSDCGTFHCGVLSIPGCPDVECADESLPGGDCGTGVCLDVNGVPSGAAGTCTSCPSAAECEVYDCGTIPAGNPYCEDVDCGGDCTTGSFCSNGQGQPAAAAGVCDACPTTCATPDANCGFERVDPACAQVACTGEGNSKTDGSCDPGLHCQLTNTSGGAAAGTCVPCPDPAVVCAGFGCGYFDTQIPGCGPALDGRIFCGPGPKGPGTCAVGQRCDTTSYGYGSTAGTCAPCDAAPVCPENGCGTIDADEACGYQDLGCGDGDPGTPDCLGNAFCATKKDAIFGAANTCVDCPSECLLSVRVEDPNGEGGAGAESTVVIDLDCGVLDGPGDCSDLNCKKTPPGEPECPDLEGGAPQYCQPYFHDGSSAGKCTPCPQDGECTDGKTCGFQIVDPIAFPGCPAQIKCAPGGGDDVASHCDDGEGCDRSGDPAGLAGVCTPCSEESCGPERDCGSRPTRWPGCGDVGCDGDPETGEADDCAGIGYCRPSDPSPGAPTAGVCEPCPGGCGTYNCGFVIVPTACGGTGTKTYCGANGGEGCAAGNQACDQAGGTAGTCQTCVDTNPPSCGGEDQACNTTVYDACGQPVVCGPSCADDDQHCGAGGRCCDDVPANFCGVFVNGCGETFPLQVCPTGFTCGANHQCFCENDAGTCSCDPFGSCFTNCGFPCVIPE